MDRSKIDAVFAGAGTEKSSDWIVPFDPLHLDRVIPGHNGILSSEHIEALLAMPQNSKEVWGVVITRLRCWTADTDGAPVRPVVIMVACVFPAGLGRVIARRLSPQPSEIPSTKGVMDVLCSAMARPADGSEPCRPARIAFLDADFATRCSSALGQIAIDTCVLPGPQSRDASVLPPAFAALRLELSRRLALEKLAMVSMAGMRPGLLDTGSEITPALLRCFYLQAAAYLSRQPWTRVSERQTYRLRLQDGGASTERVAWISVIGESSLAARAAAEREGHTPLPQLARGMSVFFRRFDVERRMIPVPPGTTSREALLQHTAISNPLDMVCAAPGCGRAGTGLHRCQQCKETYYCDQACQRAHWGAGHGPRCKERSVALGVQVATGASPATGPAGSLRYSAEREIALFFEHATSMPLADLEALEALGMAPPSPLDCAIPVVFRRGVPQRPHKLEELLWLMRGMATVLRFLDDLPEAAVALTPMKTEAQIDLVSPLRHSGVGCGHWYDECPDEAPSLAVRTDPILTKEERARVLAAMAQVQTGAQHELGGGATA